MVKISLDKVGVSYPIYSASGVSIKNTLLRSVGGKLAIGERHAVSVQALSDITLNINAGERIGLLGQNGMGKSTLLKVLAGILEPSEGSVNIEGRVTSLIDLSMGLDQDASGYDNIIMRSVILGATFKEAKERIAGVEEFCQLGDFLSLPMRTYSSGMVARLAFGISTAVVPDILILDEHIGTGDAEFAGRASARFEEFASRSRILAFASHNMQVLARTCTRGILLDQGRIIADAPILEAIKFYDGHLRKRAAEATRAQVAG